MPHHAAKNVTTADFMIIAIKAGNLHVKQAGLIARPLDFYILELL